MLEVDEYILVYAFRYTLGRRTNSPYDIFEAIMRNKDKISDVNKKIIIYETKQFLNMIENSVDKYPNDLIEVWNNLIRELEK